MNLRDYLVFLMVMAGVTYLIRVIPLTLIRREIKNPVIRSFLFYVPYVTLAVMTFPAMVTAATNPIAGAAAFIVWPWWLAVRCFVSMDSGPCSFNMLH